MIPQSRSLVKSFAAHFARVTPWIRMDPHVIQQISLLRERSAAHVAFKRLLARMHTHVRLQSSIIQKSLSTNVAGILGQMKALGVQMSNQMSLVITFVVKQSRTLAASVRSSAYVSRDMRFQFGFYFKPKPTLRTPMPREVCVTHHVSLQISFHRVSFVTYETGIRKLACMCFHMCP